MVSLSLRYQVSSSTAPRKHFQSPRAWSEAMCGLFKCAQWCVKCTVKTLTVALNSLPPRSIIPVQVPPGMLVYFGGSKSHLHWWPIPFIIVGVLLGCIWFTTPPPPPVCSMWCLGCCNLKYMNHKHTICFFKVAGSWWDVKLFSF